MNTVMSSSSLNKASRPYQPFGGAKLAWRSRRDELLLCGPAGTGKSRCLLEKLHFCADKYAGMRGLIVRKTRESITQTAMVTYEEKVLPEGCLGNLVRWRTDEQEYRYPNGSIIAVGGMDKSTKIMSAEYDMIYVQEATELTEEDWESLTTRLRNGVMPYQQLMADCNPGHPLHWLKLRCDRGDTLLLESRHEDNPSVTQAYIAKLDRLTGALKQRLRYGRWAATEGMVYESWNTALHKVTLQTLVSWNILNTDETLSEAVKRCVAGVDWGFTNPGVIHVYAVDGDERCYLIHEVYRTKRVINWWIAQGKELRDQYGIEVFVCDPAEPSYIEQFNDADLYAVKATNAISPGVSSLEARLQLADDGRPRFYIYDNALKERDEARADNRQPYCFEQEIDAYAWPKSKEGIIIKEAPIKKDDHAMDCSRYVSMFVDETGGNIPFVISTSKKENDLPKNYETDNDAIQKRQQQTAHILSGIWRIP